MDKETLSNYGWIVICVLVLAVMIALAGPFGTFVAGAVKSTTQGLFDVNQGALNSTGLINIDGQEFDSCAHDYEVVTTGDCSTGKTTTQTCKLCGKTSTETLPAGHKYDDTGLTCTVCGVTVVEYAFTASDYDRKMGTTTATDANVVIPETFEHGGKIYKVTKIGHAAFRDKTNLTSIVIPESVTYFDTYCFQRCTNLSSINIPKGTTILRWDTFTDCTSLTSITYSGTIEEWKNVVLGTDWNLRAAITEVVCSDGISTRLSN